jgi:hypothetical protein
MIGEIIEGIQFEGFIERRLACTRAETGTFSTCNETAKAFTEEFEKFCSV